MTTSLALAHANSSGYFNCHSITQVTIYSARAHFIAPTSSCPGCLYWFLHPLVEQSCQDFTPDMRLGLLLICFCVNGQSLLTNDNVVFDPLGWITVIMDAIGIKYVPSWYARVLLVRNPAMAIVDKTARSCWGRQPCRWMCCCELIFIINIFSYYPRMVFTECMSKSPS